MCNRRVYLQQRLVRIVASILFVGTLTILPIVSSATEILDDFEDGLFADGSPGQWRGSLLFDDNVPASVDVADGTLVLDSIEDDAYIKAELLRIGSTDGEELESSDSWSIRSQFRILDSLDGELVLAGVGTTGLQSAFLTTSGMLGVGQGFGNLSSANTNFDRILEREFVIQLDIEGDLLTGHVWPLDDPHDVVSVEVLDQNRQSRPLVYNRRTVAAYDYVQVSANPIALPSACMAGDFNCDGVVELTDLDALSAAIRAGGQTEFDLDTSGNVDVDDLRHFIIDIKGTWIGDANFDGVFDSQDLVAVFQVGQYEDGVANNSNWSAGDWNADTEFDSSDLVMAFQDGGYERGTRAALSAVPEPSALALLVSGLFVTTSRRWRSRR